MSQKSEKNKFIKGNFEMHARNAAQANAERYKLSDGGRDIIYMAIMNFIDHAFECKKINILNNNDWDELESGFKQAMQDEAIRKGEWENVSN